MPTGLSLNTTTGAISGTPTAITAAATYTVTATNAAGSTTKDISIAVNDVAPSALSYVTPQNAFVKGTAIASLSPTVGGGAVVSYSVSPALPGGLSLNTTTGVISGTPTAVAGMATYTVTATNTGGSTTFGISITVNDVAITGLSYTTATVSAVYGVAIASNTPTSSGGAVVSYAINPALPAGLSFNASTGVISGTPAVFSSPVVYTITATNSAGSTTAPVTIVVAQKPLSISGVTASNKIYDGDATATLSGGTLNGVVGSDVVTITAGTGAFANANVGTGKTVTATGFGLTGAAAANYILSAQPSGMTADITAKPLNITGITASDKTYDGNATATLSGGTLNGVVDSDVVTITAGTGAFANANVEAGKTVTATGFGLTGAAAANYSLSAQPSGLLASITAKLLTVSGVTASNKIYDGNATATLSGGTLNGIVGSEVVTITAGTGAFTNANVGIGKPVTASGYGIAGTDVVNYTLSAQPSGITADITAKPLTITGVTASNKIYDGAATATLSGGTLNGIVGSEAVTITAGTGAFANPNVGTAKVVTASGYGITGADAGNYSVMQPTGITADITAKPLNITGVTASNKSYDGNATATLSGGTLNGVVGSDVVTITAGTGAFANANVEAGKTVTATGFGLTGAAAANYSLSAQPSGLLASITAKPLTIAGVTASNKIYDGNATATLLGGTLNGIVGSEVVTITAGTGAFTNANVGIGKPVTASGYGIAGTDVVNYTLSAQPSGITASITAKPLTITGVTASNKIYDGNATATLSGGTLNGIVGSEAVTITAGTGAFANKNVGTGKTVTATGFGLTGSAAANYSLLAQPSGMIADITAKALTVTATADNKEYDGSNTATVTLADDRVSGDVLTASKTTSTFDTKDIGSGKTVTVSGINISGTDAGNYTVNNTATATANITAKALTVTAVADNKEYDGSNTATVTLADDRVSGDVLTAAKTASAFDTKNVGTGKPVTVSGISISGTDSGNYTVNTTTTATANITAKALTVTAVADNKEYDGNTTAMVTLADNRVSGDVLTASKTTSTFGTKDIGSGKTVTVSGISISGTDAGNYTVNNTATATANITAKALTVTAVADNKEYDGSNTATVTLADDRVSGDVLTASKTTSTFDTKDIGSGKPVTVSGISISGTDAANYNLLNPTATATANITAKALTVTAVADNKEYDGNTTATVTLADDRVSGDVLTASKTTSTFGTKDIGSGKPVTVSGISISGTDAGNYTVNNTTTATANITAKALTVTAVADNKEYDGSNTATVTLADDRVSGDVLTASKTTSTFDTKDIGSGKPVTVSGISISGTDAANYNLLNPTATATANITAKALTVTAVADNKEYDGNTTATVTLADDRVSGDVLTAAKTASAFDTKNVGTGKPVTVSGISISGTDSGNYTVNTTTTATANITAKALTVTAVADNKEYDGNTTAMVTLADNRVSGDVLTASKTTSTFGTKDIGSGKPVTVSGISISGTDAGNYTVNNTATATANITAKALTVTAVADNKEYDGSNTATVTLADDRVSGDVLTASKTTSTFDTKDIGSGKPVTVSGISISGTDAANYNLLNPTATATANITAKALTVTAVADNKEYDGNTTATVTLADDRVSGDVLTAAKTASAFDTKNVGTGKPVTVSGISISGTDSGNYTVNATTTATANITAKALTVTAVADNKEYDGNTTAMVTLADNRVSGDVLTASKTTSTFDTKDIGSGKPVTVSGISISGTDAANYNLLNPTATATANITAKALTVTAVADNKEYDGNNTATVTLADNRVSGDVLTASKTASAFDTKDTWVLVNR